MTPNLVDEILTDQHDWERKLAGLLFLQPANVLAVIDGNLNTDTLIEQRVREFIKAAMGRAQDFDGLERKDQTDIISEIGTSQDIYLDLLKWSGLYDTSLDHAPLIDQAKEAIEKINNLPLLAEETERLARQASANGGHAEIPSAPQNFQESDQAETPKIWSVAELLQMEFPEPRFAIPDIIPEGLTLLGGRPKVRKSWFMLQAAWSVGTGGKFFDRSVERGNVLFLALEDSQRRLQDRIKSMGIGSDALVHFPEKWRPLHKGGIDDLVIEFERKDYRMVVIDTLTRSIPGIDQSKGQGIVGHIFDSLQKLAINRQIAIVLVDHTRKPSGFAADPIDDILHMTEKTAIADCILALYKDQGKATSNLLGRGRDIEDVELAIEWDAMTRCWQVAGPAITEQREEVLDALQVLGKCQVGDIASATGQHKGNVYKRLMVLVDMGLVTREKIGRNVYYQVLE
jgi:DNA-binding transcriptional ArsR family regulator